MQLKYNAERTEEILKFLEETYKVDIIKLNDIEDLQRIKGQQEIIQVIKNQLYKQRRNT